MESKWIRVDEQLPSKDNHGLVLIFSEEFGDTGIAIWEHEGCGEICGPISEDRMGFHLSKWFMADDPEYNFLPISHWAAIPDEPPCWDDWDFPEEQKTPT